MGMRPKALCLGQHFGAGVVGPESVLPETRFGIGVVGLALALRSRCRVSCLLWEPLCSPVQLVMHTQPLRKHRQALPLAAGVDSTCTARALSSHLCLRVCVHTLFCVCVCVCVCVRAPVCRSLLRSCGQWQTWLSNRTGGPAWTALPPPSSPRACLPYSSSTRRWEGQAATGFAGMRASRQPVRCVVLGCLGWGLVRHFLAALARERWLGLPLHHFWAALARDRCVCV